MRYKFTITNKILMAVGEIEAAREIIDGAALVPEWEMKFREDALIRTVHFGTHVEGNDLSREQALKIVRDDPARDEKAEDVAKRVGVVARERDVQEVINYRNVVRFVDQLVRLGDKRRGFGYGERELTQLHSLAMEKILPPNELGVYRRMPVSIRDPKYGEIVGRPPLPIEVPYQMDDFWSWLKSVGKNEVHSVLLSGIVHFELVRIHPFIEGNGRVARAFSALLLSSFGYDVKRFFSVDEYFDKDVAKYYEKIASVERSGEDLTEWLEYYTNALSSEMCKIKERVKRLSMDARYKKSGGKQISLSERQIALMETLQVRERITMGEARDVLPMVSDDTILRDLNGLVKKKLIKKQGKTKGVRYVLKK
jgi:Fic family protein